MEGEKGLVRRGRRKEQCKGRKKKGERGEETGKKAERCWIGRRVGGGGGVQTCS